MTESFMGRVIAYPLQRTRSANRLLRGDAGRQLAERDKRADVAGRTGKAGKSGPACPARPLRAPPGQPAATIKGRNSPARNTDPAMTIPSSGPAAARAARQASTGVAWVRTSALPRSCSNFVTTAGSAERGLLW